MKNPDYIMYRLTIILLLTTSAGACVSSSPAPVVNASLEELVPRTPPTASRYLVTSGKKAIPVLPADAGRIEKILNEQFTDGVHQTAVYGQAVPGLRANEVDIRLRTTATVMHIESLAIDKPTEASIRAELASQFPRMEMKVVDRPRTNAYGVYGFAVGKWANGARCIYAWQWIDSLKTPELVGASAALRVRFCRIGVTLDELASIVDGIKLEPSRAEDAPHVVKVEMIASRSPNNLGSRSQEKVHQPAAGRRTTRDSRSPDPSLPTIPKANPPPADSAEPPLDLNLPAAAYRGPTMAAVGRQPK